MNILVSIALIILSAPSVHGIGIRNLNSTPEMYDGQTVTVSGWIVVAPEKRYIVATKDNYSMWRKGATCLSIINADAIDDRLSLLNGKRVALTGVFRSDVNRDGVVRLGLCGHTALDLEGKSLEGQIKVLDSKEIKRTKGDVAN